MTRTSSRRTRALSVIGALLVALIALRSSSAESRAAFIESDAPVAIAAAEQFVDPSELKFPPATGPGGINPNLESMEGSTFECMYSPELNAAYVPSPESRLGEDFANQLMSVTDIEITYIGTWPAEAQAAFERAVTTWENMVSTTAPITMTATWADLGSGGILGSGGPWIYQDFPNAPLADTWYPGALANALCGCDVDPGQYEFRVTMNSGFASWWYGEGPAPLNKVDFQTTAMHELTHGMGFAGTARVTNLLGTHGSSGYPAAYDRFTEDTNGAPILSYTSGTTALAGVLQSNGVYFDGPNTRTANGGNRAALYAPTTWSQGSSYSHLGNSFDNTADALITYALSYGETLRDLGPVTKGIFMDIGWPFAASTGTVQYGSSSVGVLENVAGGNVNVPVTRSGGSAGAASATCTVTGGTATSGSDFSLSTSAVSWSDGESGTKNCVLAITNDSAYEVDETVTMGLSSITGASAGTPSTTTVTIDSEDAAVSGTLQFSASTFNVTEGTATLNVSVTRTGGTDGAASATCSVNPTGTTATGSDYTLSTSAVSWAAGNSDTKNCVMTITNDATYELAETVVLTLGSITGASAGSPTTTTVTIQSDDAAASGNLQFASATYAATEGTTTTVNIGVTRTGGSDGSASATCSISGTSTATLTSDYTVTTSAVSWTSGESTTKNCVLGIVNDTAYEVPETVVVNLTSVSGAGAGSPAATTLTITSNDAAVTGSIRYAASTGTTSEADGTYNVAVTRTGGSDGAASATCSQPGGGTATNTTDYSLTTNAVSWANGESGTKNCILALVNDSLFEASETVILGLSGVSGATLGSPSSMTVTITSDDASAPGSLQFSTSSYSASEAAATLSIPVTRTGGSDGAVTATCSVTPGGTATTTADYSLSTSTVSWANGDSTAKNCVITIVADASVEANETVFLSLGSPTGGASIGSQSMATATIMNDDNAGVIQFTSATFGPFSEGAGTVSFTLSRTGGTSGTTGATCSVDNSSTATSGSDFTLGTSVVTWTNGDSANKSCTVSITNDVNQESAETIVLAVAVTSGQATVGAQSTASGAITDNDNAGVVQFTSANHSVSEAGGAYDIAVARTVGTSGAVSVTCAVSGTSTASGSDYTASNMTLTWANGESGTKACRVTPTNESTVEGDETVVLVLQGATGGVTIGALATSTLLITNDDSAGTIQLTGPSFAVAEGGTFVDITATRTGGTSGAASATCQATNVSTTNGDYSLSNATLSWADGESGTKACRITPVEDSLVEANETLTVTLTSITGAAAGTPLAATVTISNDDASGTLQFTAATFGSVVEGNTLSFTVSRTGGTSGAVSATCVVSGSTTATLTTDFALSSATVSWANGESGNRTCSVTTVNDVLVESSETVALALQDVTGGATIGTPAAASATITDDDNAGTIAFTTAALGSVGEAAGSVDVTVRRTGGSSGAVSATCSAGSGGTAASPADFGIDSATVSWANGETGDRTCSVTIIDDSSVEPTETVSLQLGGLTGQANLGSPSSATLSITDNDNAGILQFTTASFSVSESGPAAEVLVSRTGGTSGAVGVTCEFVPGGTASSNDYTLSNLTLSWADGESGTKACLVTPANDATAEPDESLILQIVSATGGVALGNPQAAAVIILNDDSSGTLAFTAANFSGSESGAIILTISRSGGSQGTVFAACSVTGGTAQAGDYVLSGTPTWADGDVSNKTCVLTPVDDADIESAETVVVSLLGPTGGAAISGSLGSTTVTIGDNDSQPGEIEFAEPIPSGTSGEPLAAEVVIALLDAEGEPLTGSDAVVSLSLVIGLLSGHSATLECEGGTSVAAVNGVATFNGCRVEIPGGSLNVRIQATVNGVLQTVSEPFDVLDTARDATCDGQVDGRDALAVMRALAGFEDGLLPTGPCSGNFNGNRGLDVLDVRLMRAFAAGLE